MNNHNQVNPHLRLTGAHSQGFGLRLPPFSKPLSLIKSTEVNKNGKNRRVR